MPARLKLPKGTKLAACWGPQWSPLTVLEDTDADDVPVHWDQLGNDAKINRSQLIIRIATDLRPSSWKLQNQQFAHGEMLQGSFLSMQLWSPRQLQSVTLRKADGKKSLCKRPS